MTFSGPVAGVLGASFRDVPQLPKSLPNALWLDPWTEANREAWMFAVPGVARYLIKNGVIIEVEAEPDADPSSIALFLQGAARGFLIHQRGELPLEAVTVAAPLGGAVAIAGYSGCGKSTLAAELCRRGWRLIAEDITRVTASAGRALAWPSHDSVKLWRDACETLGISRDQLPRVRSGMEKFYVKMPVMSRPTPLRSIIRLDGRPAMEWIEIPANQNPALLLQCTFRRLQMETLGRETDMELVVGQIAGSVRGVILGGAREQPVHVLADQIVRKFS